MIEQTIRETLPPGFQRAEFQVERGMVDRVVSRPELRAVLSSILKTLMMGRTRLSAALTWRLPGPQPWAGPRPDPRTSDAVIQRLRANHPSLIDLTTGRVERLLTALGHPERRLPPVIHVAGTNGKGSTVAYLRAIAEAQGLKVHAITSPHLVRFAERIRIAGKLITDEKLEALTDRLEAANAGEPISFFEITTVLALEAFAETPADLCIVEVGLGGRFDATNVFDQPAVSVITPVDYDHLEMLGPELSKIAWEKAGIIKRGRPAVVARQPDEALEAIEREADDRMAPLFLMGRDFDAWEERGRLMVQMPDRLLDLPAPSLFGGYQFENAGLAVAAALTFNRNIGEDDLGRGVSSAVWPARFQRLTKGPLAQLARARRIGPLARRRPQSTCWPRAGRGRLASGGP